MRYKNYLKYGGYLLLVIFLGIYSGNLAAGWATILEINRLGLTFILFLLSAAFCFWRITKSLTIDVFIKGITLIIIFGSSVFLWITSLI
ncbi:hypothetical protein H7X87_00015 [Acetobacteraceae bacterium]|nr:hypothetical protein [Candidatus Parcubacteria bacterium]